MKKKDENQRFGDLIYTDQFLVVKVVKGHDYFEEPEEFFFQH